jgi:5-formyltetrahydrofolate cyclo-ligase
MSAEAKTLARKAAFARRLAAHRARGAGAAETAAEHLVSLLADQPPCTLSGYMPIRSELDPRPALMLLEQAGHQICLPVIAGDGQPLLFHHYRMGDPLVDGPFGAQVPESGRVVTPDVLITPLVAFTRTGFRLGYGGGFYDRTLEGLRTRQIVCAIGFAYAEQETSDLPLEATDQPLDQIVTDQGLVMSEAPE